ncbi:MAG: nicotinamide-nucleotide adenylyltransferase [Candidatus Thermoplasmatota archaeon]|nr:nicotinamide-nucleotide adenylyltransferase [Candidatus Thermoplasmatota archaeon]MEC7416216.1 nicotinamide-nucleotide adenylyltransferase [Candidatus Thermoplasmatota archaeon]MEC7977073.1 nicotinamide-nucleotide adenylyltransferase [Candidatus Thermoplasmatota archaeon]MEC8217049.1 nicotinamide-nucleotide adenylyltransferase [Candidatus Thermoplasmatota archaeon]MEC8671899.1 nicotinamide-nucleotide adenylyltransferase [Candidatus Thermoplasmatota archaeon]
MKRGLILGRFQPLHMGHLSLFENVIEKKEKIIVCIGSSDKKRTKENPYNALERTQMIESVLSRYKCEYEIFEIPDINNNELYVKHLEKIVPKFHSVYSGNSLVKKLFETAGYPVFVPEFINREVWQGVSIRQAMKDGDGWEMNVPPSVAKIISEIDLS